MDELSAIANFVQSSLEHWPIAISVSFGIIGLFISLKARPRRRRY